MASHLLAGVKEEAKEKRVDGDLTALASALLTYKNLAGFYPSTAQGINALINRPKTEPRPRRWFKIMKNHPLDPWGRKYQYKLDRGKMFLWSQGSDLKNKKDDIYYVPPTLSIR